MFKKYLLISLLMLMLGLFNTSYATEIKISFEGTINRVEAGTYSVGQTVSGFVTYDSETPLTWFWPNTTNFNGAINNFILDIQQVDDVTFNILAQHSSFDPIDYSVNFGVAGFDEITGLTENLDLSFRGLNLLNSISEIIEEANLADMSSATFGYTRQKIGLSDGFLQERFYGDVDSLEIMTVPMPSSLILFLTGFAGLFINSLRIKKIEQVAAPDPLTPYVVQVQCLY